MKKGKAVGKKSKGAKSKKPKGSETRKPRIIDPFLLLAILNTPLVRRQMRAKQFTRDVIDTLGKRLFEIVLPIPRSTKKARNIARETRELIMERARLRDRTKAIAAELQRA